MKRILIAAILIAILLVPGGAALEAVIGETLTLAGTAPGATTIYLFMTGPNLDPAGVPLHNPFLSAAAGQFSTARVSSSGKWEYKWNTAGIGLDAGTYTVFAVNQPLDRQNLRDPSDYSVIPVTLRSGTITTSQAIEIPEPKSKLGSLQVTVEPYGARVDIDGEYAGETPLGISLPVGGHAVDISHEGYYSFGMNVVIYEGDTTSIERSLRPIETPESLPTETIPPTPEASGWMVALFGAAICIGYRITR
ncbi:PEGA domain-containing protein [Methanocalculus taiwanensis]|nr:PEGA domain-containing protein [Methanocalculus taiwanensis]